jgi:hypothetical protein
MGLRDPPLLTRLRPFLVPATVSLFVVTLLFGKQISVYLATRNRFFLMWETADALAMILVVLVLSLVALGIGVFITRWPRVRRIYDHLFVLLLAGGVLSFLPLKASSGWTAIVWILIVLGVGYAFASPDNRLVLYARNFALFSSALAPLLLIQLLVSGNWESPEQIPVYREASDDANPVYFFVFDGLSYELTTENGEVLPEFENLKKLAGRSVMFRHARSPATRTEISLPALVYQLDVDEALRGNAAWAALEGQKSIFDLARDNGYNTGLVGYYVPYGAVIGEKLDYAFSSSHYPKGSNFLSKIQSDLIRNLEYQKDPVSVFIGKRWLPAHYSRHWHNIGVETFRRSLDVIAQSPTNMLALFHLPVPHWPFASNPDGSYFGHEAEVSDLRGASGRDGYRRHLAYVDRMVGQIVERLEATGRFDDALLIITADHGAKTESWEDEDRYHVPLLIKMPGQTQGRRVETEVSNAHLRSVIDAVLRGSTLEAQAALAALAGDHPEAVD